MKKAMALKHETVKTLVEKLKAINSLVVVEYHKLSVADLTELRRTLRGVSVEFKVYKNRLVRLAAKEAGFADLDKFLTGPNAFAFGNGEALANSKTLAQFAKKHPDLILKAGIYEGAVLDTAQINEVASLPTKDELLSMLASSLQYPIRKFAMTVKAIAEKQAEA